MNLMRLAVFVGAGAGAGIVVGEMLHLFVPCFAAGTAVGAALGVVFANQAPTSDIEKRG